MCIAVWDGEAGREKGASPKWSNTPRKAHLTKSHHNARGLPKHIKPKFVEPLRELFKNEVRRIGLEPGLPAEMVQRHPFGAAAATLWLADHILIEELRKAGWYEKTSQASVYFCGWECGGEWDGLRCDSVIAFRAAETIDFITATSSPY